MKAFWTYTLLRLGLLLGCYAVFTGIWFAVKGDRALGGADLFVVLLISALVSSVMSVRFLKIPRQRLAAHVQARAERATARFEEFKAREDDEA
ncbi:MAG: hypothetical protein NVSMB48_07460 [Marmoricola sp.]